MQNGREREKGAPVFWGWYVVAGSFLLHAVSYGAPYSFGISAQPSTMERLSRTVISWRPRSHAPSSSWRDWMRQAPGLDRAALVAMAGHALAPSISSVREHFLPRPRQRPPAAGVVLDGIVVVLAGQVVRAQAGGRPLWSGVHGVSSGRRS